MRLSQTLLLVLIAPMAWTAFANPPVKGKAKSAPARKQAAASKAPARLSPKAQAAQARAAAANRAAYAARAAAPANRAPVAAQDSMAWVQEAHGWSRTVHAMDPAGVGSAAGPAFSETLALAFENNYLLVPWSFVADAWSSRQGAHFFMDSAQAPIEARLVDVDLSANIALLKTDQPAGASLSRDRLRLDYPAADESFLVLASRDWMRQGARFLRAKADGVTVRYQIAIGNADYANARFIFDRSGKLVAVSGSGSQSDDDGWTGTARSVVELLRRQDTPRPASVSTAEQTRRQLYYWQDRWTTSVAQAHNSVSLQGLDCQAVSPTVSDHGVAGNIRETRSIACQNRMSLPLGGGYSAGMKIWTGDVVLNSTPEAASGLPAEIEKALSEEAFSDQDRKSAQINVVTVPQCDEMVVTNDRSERARVRFCTSALKSAPGLGDTALSIITMPDGTSSGAKLKYAVARLKGFDEAHSKRILEALVENVRSLP